MPVNKNASYRYRIIDNCLRNHGRRWTLEDLIDEVSARIEEDFGIFKGVSKRTVQQDISIMRSMYPRGFDAPILCRDGYYFYDDPDYSIINSPLNERDVENLQEAISILQQFKTLPIYEELIGLILKLEGKITFDPTSKDKIIEFDSNEKVKGVEFIQPLYEHIRNKKVLEIGYLPFLREDHLLMTIHPYLLKEFNNRWFLIGYNEEIGMMSHLALDRIRAIIKKDLPWFDYPGFTSETYFKHVLGITIPENAKPEKIELFVSKERAPYIITKPIHSSQEIIKESAEGMVIRLHLAVNKELVSEVLSFGKDVKVIKPQTLAEIVKESLIQAMKSYVS